MRLTSLHVARVEYGSDKGELHGRVKFTGDVGNIEINLDARLSARIVTICAEAIVEASQATAALMAEDVIEGVALTPPEKGVK